MPDISTWNIHGTDYDIADVKARANLASSYSASSAYSVGDCCIYNGDLYKCTTAIPSGGEAWNSSHWTKTSALESGSLDTKADKTNTVLNTTLSRGRAANAAVGTASIAFGDSVTASGAYSQAVGQGTVAQGNYAHAEGYQTQAIGNYSHSEGGNTFANGYNSHTEGAATNAVGAYSHAEGQGGTALGEASHAEGIQTTAVGNGSSATGKQTAATADYQHVSGMYNVQDSYDNWPAWTASTSYAVGDKVKRQENNKYVGYICKTANSDSSFTASKWTSVEGRMNYAEIVGNGSNGAQSNARALDWDGNEHLKGDIYINANADQTGGTAIGAALAAAPTEETISDILEEIETGNELLSSIQSGIEPLSDRVPSYFRENLDSALAAYKTNAEEVGVDGDSCIFITDTHWGSNQKHSPDLIRWLVKHSNLRNVFCGGDILDTSSIENEMRKGYDFIERFTDIPGGLKTVIGNHDYNKNNHTEQPEYWLSKAQVYSMFYPKAEMEIHDFQCLEPGEGYYEFSFYVDVPATNTRYLFVSIPFGSVYTVTKDWVVAQLTDNPTKNFVIISHYLYNASSGTYPGGANGLIYAVKSFSNLKAWLFGHTHLDLVLYTSTGIPLVCTDTDSSRIGTGNPYTYTIGTITEQAFDIVTVNHTNRNVECARVGRGKNRRINGGLNTVAVSGTLALTPSITPTGWESSDTSIATVSNGTVTGVAAGQATIKAISADKEEYWCVSVSAT